MKDGKFEVGDIVQVKPESTQQPWLRGVLVIVTEPQSFGLRGYVSCYGGPRDQETGWIYIRLNFDEVVYVGKAEWVNG